MAASTQIPVALESGDRLSRAEFHRRYCEHPEIKKAELVEGVVYVASPVRAKFHGRPHSLVMAWLGTYWSHHPDVDLQDNATVRLDRDNEVQPDAFLWRPGRESDGGPRETEDGYIEGAPQLVVEIAASFASYDLHDKLRAYRRNGVQEYVVWRVLDEAIDWLQLRDDVYVPMTPDANGIIESQVFPGLRLPVAKLLGLDVPAVLAALE
jgi:Uma2 family endonuclease